MPRYKEILEGLSLLAGFCLMMINQFHQNTKIKMSLNVVRFQRRHWWQSCYIWAVWVDGPLGFGLLLSCRLIQAAHLYCVFVKRRLFPIRSYISLPLALLPWVAWATVLHIKQPLNNRCHMGTQWVGPHICFPVLYIAALVCITGAIHHIEFKFDELKDLWRAILVTMFSVVMSLNKKESFKLKTMGEALGIPDSGIFSQNDPTLDVDTNDPLDKLLQNKRFLLSFMEFADSCFAGESVHFYNEVQQLEKIPVNDPVKRIYMVRHIIEKYISTGSPMEVNISHRTRQEILTTPDLAHPDLFKNAVNELLQLINMNLAKDYWSSVYFLKFKEEAAMRSVDHELEQVNAWNFSPRLSSVHCPDDPFYHIPRDVPNHDGHGSYLQ
ncbi:hypothetical protein M8C21_030903 [Ambrosia artemisiifolia]|uniref:RGS domain-containing protein n=1 Tax=Ambrosia artemisiifolia TaxID=4212 RepID=A0AAD5GQ77_AMBAR|nr:hypothetical protein M8C21_030903 [Ambrosia artemisiifolia]